MWDWLERDAADGRRDGDHRALAASHARARETEARFRAAAEGMKEAFYIFDAVRIGDTISDFRLVEANANALVRLRCTREDGIGRLHSDLAPNAQGKIIFRQLAQVIESGIPCEWETEVSEPGLGPECVHIRAVPLRNGVAITSADITEQRRAQHERELNAAILKNMSGGLCLVRGVDGTIVYTNQKFDDILGYAPGELQGKSVAVLNHAASPAEARAAADVIARQIREQGGATYEVVNLRKDGRVITCRATASIIHDRKEGEVFVVVQWDTTDRKRLEEERDGFFTLSLDMLAVAGFDGYYKRLNPAWEATLGWSLEELMAEPWLHFVHPDDRQATMEEGQGNNDGKKTFAFENRYACKDGSYRVLQWRAVPSQNLGLIFAAARDVTPLREAEAALIASLAENVSSLAEKEVLLKEIHHRVKNNLQVVSSLLKLHGDQISDPVAKMAFQDSQDRVRAIALLHEKLYQSKNLGSVGMADYCDSLLRTLLRAHGRVARARVSIDAAGVSLPVDLAVPCALILNELVTNALKHAFPGADEPAPEIKIVMQACAGQLMLSVSDNGVGFPAGFDFSKSQTLGTQLVKTLARQLRAEVSTTTAHGTQWVLRFPMQPGEVI